MTETPQKNEQLFATVIDRKIAVTRPTDAQMMLVGRMQRQLGRMADGDLGVLELVGKMMDIIDSLVLSSDDREWLEDQIVARNVEMKDLLPLIDPEDANAKPAKKPRAVRSPVPPRR